MDGAFPSQKGQSFDNGGRGYGDREGGIRGFRGNSENAKTKLCTRWLQGDCRFGDRCNFAHGEQELRNLPPREGGPRDFPAGGRGRGFGGFGGRGPAPGRGYGGRGPGGYDGGYGGYGAPQPHYGGYGMEQMHGGPGSYGNMRPQGGHMQGGDAYAKPGNVEPGPNGWFMYRTPEGEAYFHHHQSNVTQWDRPADWPM